MVAYAARITSTESSAHCDPREMIGSQNIGAVRAEWWPNGAAHLHSIRTPTPRNPVHVDISQVAECPDLDASLRDLHQAGARA
jgi:hypothetical protein